MMVQSEMGYCGSSCAACALLHVTRVQDRSSAARIATQMTHAFHTKLDVDAVWCDGCHAEGRRGYACRDCSIAECARARGLTSCARCGDYPCERLAVFLEHAPQAAQTLRRLRVAPAAGAAHGGLDAAGWGRVARMLQDLSKTTLAPENILAWDKDDHSPDETIRGLLGPKVGLHLILFPKDCGGLGGAVGDCCRFNEELARIDLGLATSISGINLGSEPLLVAATPQQRQRWLARAAAEGLVVAYGVTEPEAGSNLAALKTKATPVLEGGKVVAYRLNGTKQFITNGPNADLYTILASTPAGPSFFVVERGMTGLSAGPHEVKHGIRTSNTSQVILDDVQVPADHLIGLVEGKGLEHANEVFGITRLGVASFGLGGGEGAIALAIAHARRPSVGGEAHADRAGIAHKLLLPHVVRLEAARTYIREVAARIDSGEPDQQTAGAVAKLFATEAGNAAAEAAMQALGAEGYLHRNRVEKMRRDVRITSIYEGTSEILQNIIFSNRAQDGGRYRRAAIDVRDLGAEVEAELVARASNALAVMLSYPKLGTEQDVRFALADRMTDVEVAIAFCGRAAGAAPALQAACRLFAREVAHRMAGSIARFFAAAPERTRDDVLRSVELDALLWHRRADHDRDVALVNQWMIGGGWPAEPPASPAGTPAGEPPLAVWRADAAAERAPGRSLAGSSSATPAGLDDETRGLILQTLADVCKDLVAPEATLQWDGAHAAPESVLRTLVKSDVGLHLVFFPEEHGGLGAGARDVCRLCEELAKADVGVAAAFAAMNRASGPLVAGGTDAQRKRWLGRMAEAGRLPACAISEAASGDVEATATPVIEGGKTVAYRLQGTKALVTNAGIADLFLVLARAPGGPSVFVVERDAGGLSVGPEVVKHGLRGASTAPVVLEDVRVDADRLVGGVEGQALRLLDEVACRNHLVLATFGLGGGESALARAIAYSRERKQFGRPLCQFKGYTHKLLLPHVVRLEAARAYIEEIATRIDRGETGLQTEGAIAKLFASEVGVAAADSALQAHGGYGYTREYLVEKIKRDVRATTLLEGTSERLQGRIFAARAAAPSAYGRAAADLRPFGPSVAAEAVALAAEALAALLRHLDAVQPALAYELADRMVEVEHAMALCRRAASHEALRPACRVFAAEIAGRTAATIAGILTTLSVPEPARAELLQGIAFDRLLWPGAELGADQDRTVEWFMGADWPRA